MRTASSFALFVLIGGVSSVVNLVARILFDRVTSYEWAIVLAFPVALIAAFLLNRALVFRRAGSMWRGQFLRFLLVNLVTLAQVFVVSETFAQWVLPAVGWRYHGDTLAHAIGLLSPIFTSFWAHKHFTFGTPDPATSDLRR